LHEKDLLAKFKNKMIKIKFLLAVKLAQQGGIPRVWLQAIFFNIPDPVCPSSEHLVDDEWPIPGCR
jgi:hypothetical protein